MFSLKKNKNRAKNAQVFFKKKEVYLTFNFHTTVKSYLTDKSYAHRKFVFKTFILFIYLRVYILMELYFSVCAYVYVYVCVRACVQM